MHLLDKNKSTYFLSQVAWKAKTLFFMFILIIQVVSLTAIQNPLKKTLTSFINYYVFSKLNKL